MEPGLDPPSEKGSPLNADLPLLWAWERRRWAYNAILVVWVGLLVLLMRRDLVFDAGFCAFLIAEAVLANVCFCAGPVADGYLHRMGLVAPGSSRLLFAGGLLISLPVSGLMVLLFRSAHMN